MRNYCIGYTFVSHVWIVFLTSLNHNKMGRTALIPFSVRVSVPGDLKILIGSKAPNHPATPSNSHSTERVPLRSRFVKTWKISDIVASTPRNTLSKPQNPWTLISFAQIIVYDVGMFRSIACDLPRTRKS